MDLFATWYSGDNFDAWKLNTVLDYVAYVGVILLGIVMFFLAKKWLDNARTPEKAIMRVGKRLKRLGGKSAEVYYNVSIPATKRNIPCDILYVDDGGLYLVKVYERGGKVFGRRDGEYWRLVLSDGTTLEVENPLPQMAMQSEGLVPLLYEEGVRGSRIRPLVVCADNYETPQIKIDDCSCVVAYQRLKEWRKQNPLPEKKLINTNGVNRELKKLFEITD